MYCGNCFDGLKTMLHTVTLINLSFKSNDIIVMPYIQMNASYSNYLGNTLNSSDILLTTFCEL